MAIFEKKLRSIANTIKDEFIKKYVLEYFLEKITELTPHTNQNNNPTPSSKGNYSSPNSRGSHNKTRFFPQTGN